MLSRPHFLKSIFSCICTNQFVFIYVSQYSTQHHERKYSNIRGMLIIVRRRRRRYFKDCGVVIHTMGQTIDYVLCTYGLHAYITTFWLKLHHLFDPLPLSIHLSICCPCLVSHYLPILMYRWITFADSAPFFLHGQHLISLLITIMFRMQFSTCFVKQTNSPVSYPMCIDYAVYWVISQPACRSHVKYNHIYKPFPQDMYVYKVRFNLYL